MYYFYRVSVNYSLNDNSGALFNGEHWVVTYNVVGNEEEVNAFIKHLKNNVFVDDNFVKYSYHKELIVLRAREFLHMIKSDDAIVSYDLESNKPIFSC